MNIGTPYTKGAGYFVNDIALRTRREADIQTCAHCQHTINMQEWKKKGAWCAKEMKPLCLRCGKRSKSFGCEPFMQKFMHEVESQVRYQRFVEDAGLNVPVTPQTIFTGQP